MDCINKVNIFNNIYEHHQFSKEAKKLFGKDKTAYHNFQNVLIRKLGILDSLQKLAVDGSNIEKLNCDKADIYCIRFVNKEHNPRVLFFFFELDTDDDLIILLTAIQEKRSSDYESALNLAVKRAIAIRKEFDSNDI